MAKNRGVQIALREAKDRKSFLLVAAVRSGKLTHYPALP
jgi:hypothetical protein